MSGDKVEKIKGVLLDLDNTLYDYNICNDNALKKVFLVVSKKFGISKNKVKRAFYTARDQVKIVLDGTASSHSRLLYFKKMIENLKGATDAEFSLELHEIFWREYFNYMLLRKDAKEFLDFCKENSKKIVIITDFTAEMQLKKIKHLGISKYIHFIITSEEVGKEKLHTDIFYAALQKLKCSPNEVIMVGDDEKRDIQSAEKLKIRSYKSFKYIKLNTIK